MEKKLCSCGCGKELKSKDIDKVWGKKFGSEIISKVIKARNLFQHKKERETPLTLLEASLATEPTDSDWFPIVFDGETNPYIEYLSTAPQTGLTVFTITGNFVWVRAVVDRTNIDPLPPPDQVNTLGIVTKVLMNF